MSSGRIRCPWCSGQVAWNDGERMIAHSIPECDGYQKMLATQPEAVARARVSVEIIDDGGRLRRKGQA